MTVETEFFTKDLIAVVGVGVAVAGFIWNNLRLVRNHLSDNIDNINKDVQSVTKKLEESNKEIRDVHGEVQYIKGHMDSLYRFIEFTKYPRHGPNVNSDDDAPVRGETESAVFDISAPRRKG